MMKSKNISESELLLNSEASIYHLNLFPNELGDTIFLVGDPARVKIVSSFFDRIDIKKSNREFITHTGMVGNQKISVVSTGIGVGAIDIVINELDALANINFETRQIHSAFRKLNLIRLGTCGSLKKDFEVDSVIFSNYGISFDGLLKYYKTNNDDDERSLLKKIENVFKELPTVANAQVTRVADNMKKKFRGFQQSGITLTCQGFFGPQYRDLRAPLIEKNLFDIASGLRHGEDTIVNLEMETSAIYGLAKLLGHDYCSISLVVANRVTQTVSKNHESAIKKMIEQVFSRFFG